MKKTILSALVLLLSLVSCQKESTDNSSSDSKPLWKMVFNDEFDENKLNTENYDFMIGDGSLYGMKGYGNNEKQYYTDSNSSLENGVLSIMAKKEKQGDCSYTSSRIRTKGKFSLTYGKIEARISLPEVKGLWPAFWMLPEDDFEEQGWPHSGEIDIMEAKGRVDNMISGTLHFTDDDNKHAYKTGNKVFDVSKEGTIADYHVYGIIWRKEKISWYCDDEVYMSVNISDWMTDSYKESSSPFDKPFHILFNMAVGGDYDNGVLPPSDFEESCMDIDYLRVYQLN